jgi:hypothetical protein
MTGELVRRLLAIIIGPMMIQPVTNFHNKLEPFQFTITFEGKAGAHQSETPLGFR